MIPFLPDETSIAQVRLRTAHLERLLGFYRDVLGLKVLEGDGAGAALSATGQAPALIVLSEELDAVPRPLRATGLYHFAVRYPSRPDLAHAYARLVRAGYPIEGAADHGVSEALYLSDPDGNGVELYADRPRAQWSYRDGQLAMTTAALDLEGLLASIKEGSAPADAPAGLDIGHIHLHVADLGKAERFYREFIGLSVTQRTLPGALFLSAGGYHHHLGVNTWAGDAPAPPKSAGLISYRVTVPVPEILYCLEHRAPLLGYEAHREASAGNPDLLRIRDPNGNWLEIQAAEGAGLADRCGARGSSMTKENRSDKLHRSIMNRCSKFRKAAGLAALGALLAGCHKSGPPPYMPPPAPVSVATAVAQDVPVYLDEIGQGAASESVMLTPQVSGRITERHFEDGAELKQGQLLYIIDPRPFQAALDSAQAQLAQSKAALELARSQLEMYNTVSDARAVSKMDHDTKKNTVAVDEAQVLAAQAALDTAKLNLEYCYIRSPIDGRAGRRLVDAGNIVTGNQTGLLSIQRLDPMYADFIITERDLPRVQEEMAHGTLRTLVRLPSDTEATTCPGELTFLDNAVQNSSGTVNLRATFSNPGHRFWPGQFVRVRLVLSIKKGAVLVPNEATQIGQQGPFVYVVKPDATAELRQVTLGQRQGDRIVIENGVASGEQVVVTGQLAVTPGGKVRIDTGQQNGPAAATGPASPVESGTKAGGSKS